jgi:hypothetical protein
MVVDSAAHEVLGVDTRLDYRDANAGCAGSLRDVHHGGPSLQKLRWRTARRIREETDLHDLRGLARPCRHKLITRGSQWRMSFLETRSSQGRSYRS